MQPEKDDNEEFITKVFTNNDRSLKLLGELLSNQVSRDILRLLIEKEMYANEIAIKMNLQFSLISHHLKKMGEIGLLSINKKRISKNGQLHKYYKINSGIFLLPNHAKEEIEENRILKKIFKKGIKFVCIGICSFFGYLLTNSVNNSSELSFMHEDINLTIPFLIIILGLVIERIVSKKRKK